MAKSIRSKIKKRFRTAKRVRIEKLIIKPAKEESYKRIQERVLGVEKKEKLKGIKNAFLYPNDPEAEIPQSSVKTPIDFRCEAMPMAAYAFSGNRRKYNAEEKKYLDELKDQHEPQKIIAGKGAKTKKSKSLLTKSLKDDMGFVEEEDLDKSTKKSKSNSEDKNEEDEDMDSSNSNSEDNIVIDKFNHNDSDSDDDNDVSPELRELSRKICSGELKAADLKKNEVTDSSRKPVMVKKTGKNSGNSSRGTVFKKQKVVNKNKNISKK